MVGNMTTLFAKVVLQRSSFLNNLKPSNKKIGLQKNPNSRLFFLSFPVMFATPTVT